MGDEAPHKDIAGQAGSGEPQAIVSEDTRQKVQNNKIIDYFSVLSP
jgi:hypothetical protein